MSTTATTATPSSPATILPSLPTLPSGAVQGKRGRTALPLPEVVVAVFSHLRAGSLPGPVPVGTFPATPQGKKDRNALRGRVYAALKAQNLNAGLADYATADTLILAVTAK